MKRSNKQKSIQKNIKPVENRRPAKPSSITDIAIRDFINHLFTRNVIVNQNDFAVELGFTAGSPFIEFMKERRNFPKQKLSQAIDVLVKKYYANAAYLNSGTGNRYKGKVYEEIDYDAQLKGQAVSENILNIQQRNHLQKLKDENERLLQLNEQLTQQLTESRKLADTQAKLIKRLESE